MTGSAERPLRLGVSSCLLGEAVRYDGGHKRNAIVTERLGPLVEWVPVCPELEAGMGVPRPPVRLVRAGRSARMLEVASGRDHTARMRRFAARRVRQLRDLDLCGYVLKQASPSCGLSRVPLHGAKGRSRREGTGLFAAALREAFPDLPIEEEGRLEDPARYASFVERVLAYARLQELFRGRWTTADVAAFHAAHELQLMAHSRTACAALGRLVAAPKKLSRAALRRRYTRGFMAALARPDALR